MRERNEVSRINPNFLKTERGSHLVEGNNVTKFNLDMWNLRHLCTSIVNNNKSLTK